MINLLPDSEKMVLKTEETKNKILAVFVFVLSALLLFILILFSLEICLSRKEKIAEQVFQSQQASLATPQFNEFKKTIQETNENLLRIDGFYNRQIALGAIFEKLSNLVPKTVYFTNLSVAKKIEKVKENGKEKEKIFAQINVSGFAETRQDLFFFKKDLDTQKDFKEIYFSPSSWIASLNPAFSFSFIYPLNF